jgi:hypothetical protein
MLFAEENRCYAACFSNTKPDEVGMMFNLEMIGTDSK